MNKTIILTALFVLMNVTITLSQTGRKKDRITISGYVKDKVSGETLIGSSVWETESGAGNQTNSYGYYTVQVSAGQVNMQASYIGYQPELRSFFSERDTVIHFELDYNNELSEVVVTAKRDFSPSGSSFVLNPADIKVIPVVLGETDVLKSLQYVPGVQAGAEGSAGIYVRGGGADQNLFLLDGVPLYNVGHVFGMFSVFNGDAVKKVSLHKGSFPARFGGRLSSVIDIRLKDGDMQKYHGSFSIGLLSSRLNLEGPLIKGKTSFNFSARRSYFDLFTRAARLFTDDPVPDFFFYDINAKVNHKFSDKSRLYLSFYKGKDKLGSFHTDEYDERYNRNDVYFQWGNTVASIRWNYIFSNKLFMNATASFNEYKYDFNAKTEYRWDKLHNYYESFQYSGIKDYAIHTDWEYFPTDKHQIRFGSGLIFHRYNPEVHGSKVRESDIGTDNKEQINHYLNDVIEANEALVYAEDEFTVFGNLKANLGVHFSLFNVQGKTHLSIQPRTSLGYEVDENWSLKASYTQMNQNIHLLTNSSITLPTDLWVPITKNLKPMSAHQFSGGVYYDTHKGYDFSVEGFYKRMNNLLEYKDGASWSDAYTSWEDQVEGGKGWSYGVEFFARKTFGHLTGTAGYTLGWNYRKFPTINHGRKFHAKYDRRHDVNLTLAYQLSKKVDVSASWIYATGNNSTLAQEEYQVTPGITLPGSWNPYIPGNVNYVEARNNFRLPATHHLDLNINYHRSPNRMWSFSIYNLYNRANPYLVFPGYSEKSGKETLMQYSLFRFVPSVTFTCKF